MSDGLMLCVEINDLMYELKILLPRNHPKQAKIDKTMAEYQKYFIGEDKVERKSQ